MRPIVWAIATLSVACSVTAAVLVAAGWHVEDPSQFSTGAVGMLYPLAGALILHHRPRNHVGWALLVSSVASVAALAHVVAVAYPDGPAHWLTLGQPVPLYVTATLVPLLFPDGAPPSRRWYPLVAIAAAGPVLIVAANALGNVLPPAVSDLSFLLAVGCLLTGMFAGVAAVITRWRRARSVERLQLRWLLVAVVVQVVAVPALAIGDGWTDRAVELLIAAAIPTAIVVAVLRYRLWAIDRLLNRALVYTSVTVALAGIYAALAVLPTTLLDLGESDLLVAGATLTAAAAFRPLRQRVQRFVDRRFYRARYDRERTVESFATRLRQEVDLRSLGDDLGATVRLAVAPAHVSLWVPGDRGPA